MIAKEHSAAKGNQRRIGHKRSQRSQRKQTSVLCHLFATPCIENGVDIPTVSRWLGHQDGGALCMKTYGHLRDEHSTNEAKKVTF
jgi:site-specific recombinase XerD